MASEPIPVVIVTGFLGSGKTTLLNHLLNNKQGARIGVIVNDFGSVNVDAILVNGQVDSMLSLSNGCLCCVVDAGGLDAMLGKLARPGQIDLIVIEASGLADPRDLIRMMAAAQNPDIAYHGLIEVVDAEEFGANAARHPELLEHLKVADLIVLNKIDRVPDHEPLLSTVDSLAAGAPVLPTEHGRIDPAMLFDGAGMRVDHHGPRQLSFEDLLADERGDHAHSHLHAGYQSVEFTTEEPLHPRRFLDFLNDRPAGVYRIKGFAYFGVPGHEQKFLVQVVGGFVRFERVPWERGEEHRTQLVLIGAGVDTAAALDRLRACEYIDTCALEEQSMLAILRYLED